MDVECCGVQYWFAGFRRPEIIAFVCLSAKSIELFVSCVELLLFSAALVKEEFLSHYLGYFGSLILISLGYNC